MNSLKKKFPYYHICQVCALKMGGVFPEGHVCTVIRDQCGYCGFEDVLIPWVDFNWPEDKELDKVSKRNRD